MMDIQNTVKGLHPLEIKVLLQYGRGHTLTTDLLQKDLGFNMGQANQAFSWLSAKELVSETARVGTIFFELSELGREYIKQGTPQERMINLLEQSGPLALPEVASRLGLDNKDAGSAFGQLAKEGVVAMDEEKKVYRVDRANSVWLEKVNQLLALFATIDGEGQAPALSETALVAELREIAHSLSKKRGGGGVFKLLEREKLSYQLNAKGDQVKKALVNSGLTGDEIGNLTTELLKSGGWRTRGFRSYSLDTPPVRVHLGRKNPYVEYLENLKNKLVSLGFEEFDGPLVESEFWNSDALFMPQFHAARDIHDVFYVKQPAAALAIEQPYLDNVAAAHENGWKTGSRGWEYTFDRDFTRRLLLRSQGTVLSAKALKTAKVPGKYFGVVRCFRYDAVDATHAADFYQTEGIVLGEEVNLKTLLGLLKIFAEEVAGAKEVKYVPAYFPFTEPSVEVHMKHPVLGWMELGGAGIFRPEVTQPQGVSAPVLAWGLGIDRMAMMSLGLNDIRHLFTQDIEQVRLRTIES